MGIFSFLTAAPVNFFMGAVMIVLACWVPGVVIFNVGEALKRGKSAALLFPLLK